jgi:NAD+ kinase
MRAPRTATVEAGERVRASQSRGVTSIHDRQTAAGPRVDRLGVIVHPSRNIDGPLRDLFGWAERRGVAVIQVPVAGQERLVAEPGEPGECDLIVSIGGDGTMLAAIRAAVTGGRPVLGVACGSLGVLTTISADDLPESLDRFRRDDWESRRLPALDVACDGTTDLLAFNDLAIVRAGIGQVRVTSRVDGILFSRLAGDGCIVSTPIGSSAYTMAAGGPLVTPETEAFILTSLPTHGGSRQPLVIGAQSTLTLEVSSGIGGVRLEIDGQIIASEPRTITVGFQPAVATLVAFPEQDHLFTGLRRRRLIVDSPRIAADEARGEG